MHLLQSYIKIFQSFYESGGVSGFRRIAQPLMPTVKLHHEVWEEEEKSKSGNEVIEPSMLAPEQNAYMDFEHSGK